MINQIKISEVTPEACMDEACDDVDEAIGDMDRATKNILGALANMRTGGRSANKSRMGDEKYERLRKQLSTHSIKRCISGLGHCQLCDFYEREGSDG